MPIKELPVKGSAGEGEEAARREAEGARDCVGNVCHAVGSDNPLVPAKAGAKESTW